MAADPTSGGSYFGYEFRLGDVPEYERQSFRVVLCGLACDVSFGWEPAARRLTCFCTCPTWTHEVGCWHVSRLLDGDSRATSGDGDLAVVLRWATEAAEIVGCRRHPP